MIHTCIKGKGLASLGRSRLCREAIFWAINMGDYGRHFLSTLLTFLLSLLKALLSTELESMGSLTWPCLCQQCTFTWDFLPSGLSSFSTLDNIIIWRKEKESHKVSCQMICECPNHIWNSECSYEENSQFIVLAFVTLFIYLFKASSLLTLILPL